MTGQRDKNGWTVERREWRSEGRKGELKKMEEQEKTNEGEIIRKGKKGMCKRGK